MLIVVQYPFADIRPFLSADTHRLARPEMFVRRAGGRAERMAGAPERIWPAEGEFWTAKRAVRFEDHLDAQRLGPWDPARFNGAFRRLFWKELTLPRGRFELGISNAPRGRYPDERPFAPRPDFDAAECVDILRDFFLATPIDIASQGKPCRHELATAGRPLAGLVLEATTRWTDVGEFAPETWWVRAGQPVCLVEYGEHEAGEPPRSAATVGDLPEAFDLAHYRFRLHNRVWPVWLLNLREPSSPDVRLIRLHVLRLHAELETFRLVLGLLGDEARQPAFAIEGPRADALDDYLRKAIGLLSKNRQYGTSSDRLVRAAWEWREATDSGEDLELVELITHAARLRPTLAELLDEEHPARKGLGTTVHDAYPELEEL